MPIRVDDDLPVKKILEDENIFVMGSDRAIRQDIRPLDILILNYILSLFLVLFQDLTVLH